MSFTAPKFTNAGKQLQIRGLAGETINFTKIKMGDGNLTVPIAALTDVINTIVTLEISTIKQSEEFAIVKAYFSNSNIETGFYWREVGLFAADPDYPDDRSKDILYCYQNAGELAEYIPTLSSQIVERAIAIAAIVGDATSVTATIGSQAYITTIEFNEHTTDNNVHLTDETRTKIESSISKVSNGVAGNVAVLTSEGGVADSGLKFSIYDGGLRITYDDGE